MQRSTALASQLSGISGWLLIRSSLYPLSGMYPYPQKYDEICFGRDMFPRTSGWESVSGIGEARHPIHSPHLRLGSVDASIVIGANHYTTFKNPSFQRFQPLRMKITKYHLRLTPFPWLSTMFIQKYQLDPVDLVSALLPVGTVSHSLYRSAPQNQSKKHTFQTKPKITQ